MQKANDYTRSQILSIREMLNVALREIGKEDPFEHIDDAWAMLNKLHGEIDEGLVKLIPETIEVKCPTCGTVNNWNVARYDGAIDVQCGECGEAVDNSGALGIKIPQEDWDNIIFALNP